jgi:hypothetical protein
MFLTIFYSMGIGGMIYSLKNYLVDGTLTSLRQRYISRMEINNMDPLYEQVQNFLKVKGLANQAMNHLTASL